ncbi:D-xylose ABC transporter substrate-binding protein [Sorangium sp. So ce764]|uniref:D-xylose ABC transporter substrate-binding protein n=1 Tax=unclassified Sorangium TaxID=2621164 RepID=UPI003F60E103
MALFSLAFSAGCSKPDEGGASASKSEATAAKGAEAKGPEKKKDKITIGFSMDTLKEERWQRDRDLFKAKAEALGAQVLVQSANSDDALQNSQAENLLTQGVDVLVVVPHNAKTTATIVESAHKQKVPVIAYDRLILDSDLDLYVSFDNVKVGELQADALVKKFPKGNYILIGGSPTDNNAKLFREGQMNILKPLIDKGDIKTVADQWAKDWQPVEGLKITENALTKNNNNVTAVVASNDGLAGAAVQALGEQKLAGKVGVSGQDAELAACQRIAAGTQSMTVYKPLKLLAEKAAELAVKLAKKEPVGEKTQTVNNGKKDVPSVLITPVAVDKDNLASTVIADGFHKVEDVYKDLPKDQWPAK